MGFQYLTLSKRYLKTRGYFFGLLLLVFLPVQAYQQGTVDDNNHGGEIDHSRHKAMLAKRQSSEETAANGLSIPNVTVLNQHGEKITMEETLQGNSIVVINTIFTTCTTICPIIGVQFSRVQNLLQNELNEDALNSVLLLSISVDPTNDTPERLDAWQQKIGGGPGWVLVTGDKSQIDYLLKAAGLFTPSPTEHSPITLIGNPQQKKWIRISGFSPPEQLVRQVHKLMRQAGS